MRRNRDRARASATRRRGVLSAEFLLIMPVALLVLLGMIQFGLWLEAQRRISAAGREGARVAALGGTGEDVELAVRRSLGRGRVARATVHAALTDAWGGPLDPGQPVAVGVAIPAVEVVPDLLRFIGISHRERQITALVVMRRE